MKPIPPTLRMKKRYIAFKVRTAGRFSKKDVAKAIVGEALRFFGELMVSKFVLRVLEYDEGTAEGFLLCDHRYKDEVITAITLVGEINSEPASIQILGVSGTIEALKRKFLKDDTN